MEKDKRSADREKFGTTEEGENYRKIRRCRKKQTREKRCKEHELRGQK